MFGFPDLFWVGVAFPHTSSPNETSEPAASAAQMKRQPPTGHDLKQSVDHIALTGIEDVEVDSHLDNLWQNCALGLVIIDRQGQVQLANQRAERILLGTTSDPTRLGDIEEYLDLPSRQAIGVFVETQFASCGESAQLCSEDSSLEVRLTPNTSSESPGGAIVSASVDCTDDIARWVRVKVVWRTAHALSLSLEETTELRRLANEKRTIQQQLWQLQRLELVNHLSSGIAHELNNMLQIVGAYGAIIQQDANCSESVGAYANEILAAACQGAVLVKRLLGFSRREPLQIAKVDLAELVAGCVKLCRHAFASNVTVGCDVPTQPVPCMLDATLIEQSLLNLAINARDAMPTGGDLTITLRLEHLQAQVIKGKRIPAGLYATIGVADTGPGIPEHLQEKVFEPFFTTKQAGSGTGLGLSLVRDILWAHDGAIDLHARPGAGSCFTVFLPLA